MKNLLLILATFSFLTGGNKSTLTAYNVKPFDCPKCREEFESCTISIDSEYVLKVSGACDKFKLGKITREAYDDSCAVAKKTMDEADSLCRTEFQKCCLKETKENLKEKSS